MPEILDALFAPSLPGFAEPLITTGRRAFATAQELYAGSPVAPARELTVGWYGTSVQVERGSFAVVDYAAGLEELVGEVVRVSFQTRSVFAYVIQEAQLPGGVQLGLTRRTYAAIARLSQETIAAEVVVTG